MKTSTLFSRFFRETRFGLVATGLILAITLWQPLHAQTTHTAVVSGGSLEVTTTWPNGTLPVSGDADIWSTGANIIYPNTTPYTFLGGTLNIATGGLLRQNKPTAVLNLNNLTLNGGTIQGYNNGGWTFDLQNNATNYFTLNSGTILGASFTAVKPTVFKNASLAGKGTITIGQSDYSAFDSYIEFQSTVITKGFKGKFEVVPGMANTTTTNGHGGMLKLNAIAAGNESFGVKVLATGAGVTSNGNTYASTVAGKLYFTPGAGNTVTLVSLTLGGTDIGPGTYAYSAFTTAQQVYLDSRSTGTITVTGAINAPTGVVATAGNANATVAFTAPVNDAGYAITNYTVIPYDVTAATTGATVTGTASPVSVTGLTNGHSYTFTVTATNKVSVTSAASTASSAVTPIANPVPNAPTNVVATAGNTQVSVSFTPSVANGSTIDHYTVTPYAGTTAGTPVTCTSSPVTITGLSNGTTYTFQLTANDLVSGASSVATSNAVIPAVAPDAPTNVAVTNSANFTARVTFDAPVNTGGAPIIDYTVTPNDGTTAGTAVTGTSSPIIIANLVSGTTYTFTVTARNNAFSSVASLPSNSVQIANNPGPPTSIVATAGNGQASVAFVAPVSTGGPGVSILDYTVTAYDGLGTTPVAGIATVTGTTSPITVTGLTNGTSYTFKVTSRNSLTSSGYSTASNAVTPSGTTGLNQLLQNDLVVVKDKAIQLNNSANSLEVYNVVGACIINMQHIAASSVMSVPESGIYLVKVKTDKGISVQKIMIK